jgi:hypothetical protein
METPCSTGSEVFRMSGWYGSMDMGGLGHPHEGDGEFFRSHNMSQEDAFRAGMTDAQLHPPVVVNSNSNNSNMSNMAKKAGMGLVAGAVVGMILLKVPAWSGMMTKQKSWQAAAVGAAIAVPLVSMYA